mmetsp:Transcript_67963/g.175143  ORF Transcript_67963/g.175143 Transcript_67963/m.175143 type:complete len:275 (+) Transcript_67963:1069-1893(+)
MVNPGGRHQPGEDTGPVARGKEPASRMREGVPSCGQVDKPRHDEQKAEAQREASVPSPKGRDDADSGLLRAVAEVVVACAPNVVLSELVHPDQAAIEVRRGSVELLAVVVCLVVVRDIIALSVVLALVQVGELLHQRAARRVVWTPRRIKEERVLVEGEWHCLATVAELHEVAAVSARPSVPSVVLLVCIGACPLEVEVGALLHSKLSGHEVILHGWVDLHNVAAAATHIVVDDARTARYIVRPLAHKKGMRPVLKDAPVLVGGHLQLQFVAET